MDGFNTSFRRRLFVALMATLCASPGFADKPPNAGNSKHKPPHEKTHTSRDSRYDHYANERYFNDRHRAIIHDYFVDEFRRGHCPPGLAKKHNGCLPPGQAKRWTIGQPLPRDVVFYDLPDRVIRQMDQIGYPPPGYRFVRVASDILMIAVGTGLVVDAIADLNAMH
ncbi:hypothetical protein [Methylomonas sp. MgM2]